MSRSNAETDTSKTSRRALWIVIAVVFIDLLGFGIIIPILLILTKLARTGRIPFSVES